MIPQDNIKDFATAAFRYYGHVTADNIITADELTVILAVSLTIHHLRIDNDFIALEGIKRTYCILPLGNLKRGIMSDYVRRASYEMNVSESVLWSKLRRARTVFNQYYSLL